MSATLTSLQNALAEIYDLPDTPDVREYLLTDRECLAALPGARNCDEQLLLAVEGDTLAMTLYIDPQVLQRLAGCDPTAALTHENLADYLTVAEGISHFVYVAWNTAFDKPVTLLELELQAEVDKYVLAAWLLSAQNAGRFPRELHRALFERTRLDPVAAEGREGLYRLASCYAGRFCRRMGALLDRKRRGAVREALAELRRFYRWGNARKLAHIERCA
ncbi:MAG TPA: hypothetical protein VF033_09765 [Steroidobacteraceae bacterium]|jgi:hypothetical protein